MKLFSTEHYFKYPWETVSSANWLKYPNRNTPHVTNVDYLWRRVDPETGCLHTARLITCKQAGPAHLASFLSGSDSSAMAFEESIVDPKKKTLTVTSRNLTLSNIITVEEKCVYSPNTTAPGTVFKQEAQIAVTGWLQFKDYIEDFCISRFQMNASKGRTALEEALERVYEETKEQITDIIRDVTGIPLQHHETPEEISGTTKDVAYLD